MAEALVSIRRLQEFMMYDESRATTSTGTGEKTDELIRDGSIKIEKASAKWIDSNKENTLHGIDLNVEPGQVIAIVGQVGAGKSSLLHTILREMPLNAGSIKVHTPLYSIDDKSFT